MRAGTLAELGSPEELLRAVAELRRKGYAELDAFTPYPVPGLEEALGLPRSRLGWMVFPVAVAGAGAGMLAQIYCNAIDYPLDVGGRPLLSLPAYIPITFESAVLFAGVGGLFILLLLCRLPELWSPVFDAEGFESATVDGFWLGIDEADRRYRQDQVEEDLRALAPRRISRAKWRDR
jgi:hypothetical protein